jgi:hypothetical protein
MNSIQQVLQKQEQMPKELHDPATDLIGEGVPVCGGDLVSPVVDQAYFGDKTTGSRSTDKDGRPIIQSSHIFKFNDKWYRANIAVRQVRMKDLLDKD